MSLHRGEGGGGGGGAGTKGVTGLTIAAGAPTGGAIGDFYLRTDTPSVPNQRLYVAGPSIPTPPPFRDIATSYGAAGSGGATLTIPGTFAVGDVMLLCTSNYAQTPSTPAPAGWTLLQSAMGGGGGQNYYIQVFWKIATVGDIGGTVTVALPGGMDIMLGLVAYSGCDPSAPIQTSNWSSSLGGGGSPAGYAVDQYVRSPSLLTTTTQCTIVEFFGSFYAAGQNPVVPATSRLSTRSPGTTLSMAIADQPQAVAATTTSRVTAMGSGASWASIALALASPPATGIAWVGIA